MVEQILRRLGYAKIRRRKLRMWEAAKTTRLMDQWVTTSAPINVEMRGALGVLRARSREQAQNNDYMQRFLQLVQTNVAGHNGIILQAKSKDPNGQLDTLANDAIEREWKEWGRLGSCELKGQHSWRSFQRMFIRSVAQDGEAFVYQHQNSGINSYGYALSLIDPTRIDHTHNDKKKNIEMGVEKNAAGRAVAYHLSDGGGYSRKTIRIDAGKIFHCYLPEWIDGVRGIPWVSQSLLRMGMLDGYEEAELVAARVASAKMGFFTSEDGGRYVGDDTDAEGNIIMDAEPGLFEQLPAGVSYTPHDPQHPTSAYADFTKSVLRGIAAGLGVSYNSLANDLEGVNYSSLRQGAIEERAVWMMLQDWMIESLNDRVYRSWLTNALERGQITVAGASLKPERFRKYADVVWQPRRWQWVDPQKEIAANETAVNLGIRSRSDIIREMGRDPEDVWTEIAAERERMKALGISTEPADQAGFLMPEENGGNDED